MAAAAATGQRQRVRALVAVHDSTEGYLVYRMNLKHLFSSNDDDEVPAQLRCFPRPVARFPPPCMSLLALAPSGTNVIVAASGDRRITFHNTDSNSASSGPNMHGIKSRPVLLPVGDDMFLAMSGRTWKFDHPGTHYEVLIRTTGPRRWAWRAIREPPVQSGPKRAICCEVTAYFVAGTRVWVSLQMEGTFSLDMVRRRWRKEGTWALPVKGRAILVPDFLGGGRFCISRHILVENTSPPRFSLSLMAVEVTSELKLLKRNVRSYLMSPSGVLGYLLPAGADITPH